ncbi:unnamed protein product [Didymodactylos carnosus]|uniref:guanylate cyclase n=1 Tax=Didymodactylos carnosus TaxID=1234261 RepID=A0A814GUQ1_9BILA|nr:unnamed protein product [Didymodactylos carnosus]CAF1000955.1 unnamed protein product [Didymodactylos carnosus]CAF3587667.1 unnamed protein product [Didymodactylos carnosus]CAF3772414.1 unnamed protein product [Didymodactylos carnosus]
MANGNHNKRVKQWSKSLLTHYRFGDYKFQRGTATTTAASTRSSSMRDVAFPLFRRFYLMRSSLRKRQRQSHAGLSSSSNGSRRAVLTKRNFCREIIFLLIFMLFTTGLLIFVLFLDLIYMDEANNNEKQPTTNVALYGIRQLIKHNVPYKTHLNHFSTIYLHVNPHPLNHTDSMLDSMIYICSKHPRLCLLKLFLIFIFVFVTIILGICLIRIYKKARKHSQILETKTYELEKEKTLTEKLLHQILPPTVAKQLINGKKAPAEYYDCVTIYFSDIVGFTSIASMCSPTETCDMLNRLYSVFDSLLEKFDVYKVETIGDAYMVASGAPERNGNKHANEISNMALAILKSKHKVRVPKTFVELKLRIGIHTGPACAAVIGSKMPRYCLFGDTINVASRMESSGLPEKIHLSETTYNHIEMKQDYIFEDRGEISIKGKGNMRTYFLLDRAQTNQ